MNMLSEELKESTKTAHIELENVLVQKIKSIRAIDDYLNILIHFYRFFAPLEKTITVQLESRLSDVSQRRKIEWILDDIRYFSASPMAIPPYTDTPKINNHLQAMGALYVIEGATLGGQVIRKMVAQRLGISPEEGFKFFSGYGDCTHRMWEDFKNFLNTSNWTQEDENAVVDAANRTFDSFKQSML